MGEKLTIHRADGTTKEVDMLKMWQPEPDLIPGSLARAMAWCKVRGYIARKSNQTRRYWKDTPSFYNLPQGLRAEDKEALDWKTYDPQEDDGALTA